MPAIKCFAAPPQNLFHPTVATNSFALSSSLIKIEIKIKIIIEIEPDDVRPTEIEKDNETHREITWCRISA